MLRKKCGLELSVLAGFVSEDMDYLKKIKKITNQCIAKNGSTEAPLQVIKSQ